MLSKLRDANLKLNFKKCKWFEKKLSLLGHIVGEGKIEMDPKKIQAIVERKPPKNVKQHEFNTKNK